MPFMPTKEAKMRYRKRAVPAMVLMIGMFYGMHWVFDQYHPTGVLAYGLALLPPLSCVLLATLIVQFLSADRDEVQVAYRRHAVAWATAGTLTLALCYNGLGVYKLVPDCPPGMVVGVFCVLLIPAALVLKRQYQ